MAALLREAWPALMVFVKIHATVNFIWGMVMDAKKESSYLHTRNTFSDLQALFLQFNTKFFWGKLLMCEVKWSPRMTLCAGVCSYQRRSGFCSIRWVKAVNFLLLIIQASSLKGKTFLWFFFHTDDVLTQRRLTEPLSFETEFLLMVGQTHCLNWLCLGRAKSH